MNKIKEPSPPNDTADDIADEFDNNFSDNFLVESDIHEPPFSFEKKLEQLLNEYSKESGSDTPDFLLAEYLSDCLHNYNKTIRARDKWFGIYDIWSWKKGEEAQYETQIRL
jgi:hypothetical protein